MKNKAPNWPGLIADLQEKYLVHQSDIAELCGVTQQAISHFANQSRNPNNLTAYKIKLLAKEAGFDLSAYNLRDISKNEELPRLPVLPEYRESLPYNVLQYAYELSNLPHKVQVEVIRSGRSLIKCWKAIGEGEDNDGKILKDK